MDVLVRGDNDAALILGADPGATMPQPAIDHLARIPTIVLDPQGDAHQPAGPRAHHDGGHRASARPGTAYRMDEIPLPLRPALQVAVSDRRRGRPPDPRGGGGEAGLAARSRDAT